MRAGSHRWLCGMEAIGVRGLVELRGVTPDRSVRSLRREVVFRGEGLATMSYPEQVYWGEAGEVSARFRPADTPPELGERGVDGYDYLATTATTRGEFGLYHVEMR